MKKSLLLIAITVLIAAGATAAEQPPASAGSYQLGTPFEADLGLGYRWVNQDGNPLAGEYEYLHPSAAGKAIIEWDPLPQRFLLETYVLSPKEYFGELDYAYKDVFMLNLLGRSLFHNTDHIILEDDPATATPNSTDFSPGATYGLQDMMNRGQIRIKAPDFPFHIYLEARNQEKKGTIQQRFLRSFSGGMNRATQTRDVDNETQETKATINSHLGPVEAEYSHTAKTFDASRNKVMTDTTAIAYTHNLFPELESSNDTIKIHTSHTGRLAAAITYSTGDKENKDSNTKLSYNNSAADISFIPHRDWTIAVRYRRFETTEDTPPTVQSYDVLNPAGPLATYQVKDALNETKDTIGGFVRYRATQNLTVRAEYILDSITREFAPGAWALDRDVTKNTVHIGGTYRLTSRMMLRADYNHMTANVPGGSVDVTYPDKADAVRGLFTWNPLTWFNVTLSGGLARQERSNLPAPFSGERKNERTNAMSTFTFLLGKKTSITPGYAFYQNTSNQPIAYTDAGGGISSESGVAYADTVHVASLSLSHAISDIMTLTIDASRSWARGNWRNAGVVAGSDSIAELTDLKEVESEAWTDLSVQYTRNLGTDVRYTYRKIDNKIDNALDGTNQIAMVTLTYKW